jgi:hypothetical protein
MSKPREEGGGMASSATAVDARDVILVEMESVVRERISGFRLYLRCHSKVAEVGCDTQQTQN